MKHAAEEMHFRQATPPQGDLIEWLKQLHEEDRAQTRASSPFWKAWRRLQEHKVLTGHSILPTAPPGVFLNPN